MLSTNLPKFQADLFTILTSEASKKAFEQAILTTFPSEAANDENAKKIAETFGKVAAAYLGALAQPLANAINDHIKEIGIMATPTALTCAVGPVAGAITPTDVQVF